MLEITGQRPDPTVPPISLYGLLRVSSLFHMNCTAVIENELEFTRREMLRDVETLAKALLAMGVKQGDIITSATSRSLYGNQLILFAANLIGAVATFHEEAMNSQYLYNYIEEFESPVCFTFHASDARIQALKDHCPHLRHVVDIRYDYHHRNFADSVLE